ncbi:HAD family hydrolase [Cereibacter sphaeroides]|uniref:sulfotransferase-like domain-containing protein n=1 Tax=Cereibacter sphaeroides TaxID=1063 RepID=UPI001F1756F4|nr:HAD family hydrolase [Cereibacter sphaeroides]MCE6952269.1 HAD family hydrolase [Cereibacter sphaeroides]
MRIAMWSGPRNLSTAMMYAFAARGDCAVWDEPFYAAYLKATGIDHPMRDEIIAANETDPGRIAARCAGEAPFGEPLFYQKHMTVHMIPGFDRSFMASCENVFLIRHPARVVASYARKREGPTLADIGFVQQADLFDEVADRLGRPPLVIDSADIRDNPKAALSALCAALGIGFTEAMLHWPAGGHPSDGIWAAHWYGAVHRSTGFEDPEGPLPDLPPRYADLAERALPHYRRLAAHRIRT